MSEEVKYQPHELQQLRNAGLQQEHIDAFQRAGINFGNLFGFFSKIIQAFIDSGFLDKLGGGSNPPTQTTPAPTTPPPSPAPAQGESKVTAPSKTQDKK
jgi:hypothetical protein